MMKLSAVSEIEPESLIREFYQFVNDESFPCVAARAAMARNHVPCFVAGHMACPKDDHSILEFLYTFIKNFRNFEKPLHSAAILFNSPQELTEKEFEGLLWQRLQSLSSMDALKFHYDQRVSADPSSPDFSFSLGGEAFFVIGMHPASPRRARRFRSPALVFNPHVQFEDMRRKNQYEKMKAIVRRRDIAYSGSLNPMLFDFGKTSEARQYSGHQHEKEWTCPLKISHGKSEHHSPEE